MNDQSKLPVMEAFYTLQGEGYHQGKAAYFIRLAGCDVGCHWCDIKESWNVDSNQYRPIQNIIDEAQKHPSKFAVITGGEPLIYNLDQLTSNLKSNDFTIAMETSGAYPLSGNWHWICLSPKKFKAPLEDIYPKVNELKVIIYNKSDFKWAEEHAEKVSKDCLLYLQVEWSKKEEMTPLVIDYIKKNPQWRISNQSHKYLNIP